jgi:hypothetical protein
MQPIVKAKMRGNLFSYFIFFMVFISFFSLSQIRFSTHMIQKTQHRKSKLVPGLKEWRNGAIDRFRKMHPRIDDKLAGQGVSTTLTHSNEDSSGDAEDIESTEAPLSNVQAAKLLFNNVAARRPKAVVVYAIAVTRCPDDAHILYEAAILAESIKNMSIRRNSNSNYDYSLYAFVHDSARNCNAPLYSLGYTVLNGKSPIKTVDREYIKVYALSLTNHKIVVMMDADTLLLQPLDQLFDLMLDGQIAPDLAHKNDIIPDQIDFISTKTAEKLVDHSFFIARTSKDAYPKMVERMKEDPTKSFDDFLNDVYGKDHFELDSCVYNTYILLDDECQDTAFDKMKMVHYSSCGAPWDCQVEDGEVCQELHRVWHKNRRHLDEDLHNTLPDQDSGLPNTFGYCSQGGEFEPIKINIVNPENV